MNQKKEKTTKDGYVVIGNFKRKNYLKKKIDKKKYNKLIRSTNLV
jgi:hypothetical protein